jgi:hypothetical protein
MADNGRLMRLHGIWIQNVQGANASIFSHSVNGVYKEIGKNPLTGENLA